MKFHDGEPLNAEAVKFNIERHLNTPGSFRKTEIGEITSVDVVNDLTVRLNLSEPLVPLLAALTDRAGMMVSPKAAKELGDKFGTQPVCAGPYQFVERVAQGKIVFERFADYWDKANIHIDRVEFVPITRLHRAPGQPALGRSADDRARLARPTWRRSAATAGSR